MKSHTRLLASLLMVAVIANATGCSRKGNDRNGEYNTTIITRYEKENVRPESKIESDNISIIHEEEEATKSIEDVIIPTNFVPEVEVIEVSPTEDVTNTDSSDIHDLLKETLYDENIDYKLVIDKYLSTEYDKRIEFKNEYLRAVYMLMINSDVPLDVYLGEIHTLMVLQQYPSCVSEDMWFKSFGHLIKLLGDYPSLHEMFIDFGMFAHELECNHTHTLDEYGAYTCDNLEEDYKLTRVVESY